jgi:hypothetical protein
VASHANGVESGGLKPWTSMRALGRRWISELEGVDEGGVDEGGKNLLDQVGDDGLVTCGRGRDRVGP